VTAVSLFAGLAEYRLTIFRGEVLPTREKLAGRLEKLSRVLGLAWAVL
jgi:hypothetical protein